MSTGAPTLAAKLVLMLMLGIPAKPLAVDRPTEICIPPGPSPVPPEPYRVDRGADGLFYIDAHVDGHGMRFLVDTGASQLTLFERDARRLGVISSQTRFHRSVLTPGGLAPAALVRLDHVRIANRTFDSVDALIIRQQVGVSLLGQNLLRQLGTVRMDADHLTIE